jgi:hypothetical protein
VVWVRWLIEKIMLVHLTVEHVMDTLKGCTDEPTV